MNRTLARLALAAARRRLITTATTTATTTRSSSSSKSRPWSSRGGCFTVGVRYVSTTAASGGVYAFPTEEAYNEAAVRQINTLYSRLDGLVQETDGMEKKLNVDYDAGVLSMDVTGVGGYVINKHAATRRIWWSSPLSGPKQFDYDPRSKDWVDSRDPSVFLLPLLKHEINLLLGIDIDFSNSS
ncbi:mitochondrial iron-sulfur cluster biosynthesis Yfh1 (frataxin) [Andalucia godoyi]|uniref:Mitochondrial iron-sulfur cluster biosynthesis Yfh1 (Frataxin) n=1 Tax=Andalucia godoyi TaxID=505711 RepID=A0A8K0AGA5_ANDGO|nr:mitochondrial iron-sulfur cluster biosynthesis Yfh1 (frataxin) [Andalucia godoyi]|eukprot:ANDGO_06231.mRNA.1 mitochondrial iron-sulfur cluster biosynthesis Yfh1 (frataxin)